MPESFSITDVPQPVLSPDREYKERPGRQIFEELSITGLNHSPIETLTAFITADSTIEGGGNGIWPEIPLAKICEYVLVDGSFVLRYIGEQVDESLGYIPDEPYVFLEGCSEIHRNHILQPLRNERDVLTGITRVYERGKSDWSVKDVEAYGSERERTISTEQYPLDMLISYPYGKGLLYPNQKTYRRLEEIEDSIRQQTGPASLSLIVTGYAGDWKKAQDTFARGARIVGIPGNADVHRVASNSTADQLMANGEELRAAYAENMHLIRVSETATLSGKSRIIAMKPTLSYINMIRMVLDEVYALLGYTITWGGMDVTEPSERVAELDLLERGKRLLLLSVQEFMRMARALFGLTEKPEGDIEEPEPEMPDETLDTGEPNA